MLLQLWSCILPQVPVLIEQTYPFPPHPNPNMSEWYGGSYGQLAPAYVITCLKTIEMLMSRCAEGTNGYRVKTYKINTILS